MKCILHVGPPKTGSTTIQTFLRKNKAALLERGVLSLADCEMPRKLSFFFRKEAGLTPWARKKNLDQPERMEALRKDTHRYIHDQIKQYQPDKLLLSSESLSKSTSADMLNMRDYLRCYASEIRILIYLRRPDFRVLSAYKNKLRNGRYSGAIGTEYSEDFDDSKTICRLGDCFGSGNITPVICMDSHPDKTAADSHIEALLKVLFRDADVTPDNFIIPERKNIAWDYKAVCYMREFNKIAEHTPEFGQYRQPLARLLQDHFSGGEKLKIRKAVAEAIVANYQAGWEDVRQQYFPRQQALFHADFSMYSEDISSQTFGAEEAVQVSLVLMQGFLKGRNGNYSATGGNHG